MGVTVHDEVYGVAINYASEFTVAKQPEFKPRLTFQRGQRWGDMHHGDLEIGAQTLERLLETACFAARPNCQPLRGAPRKRVWPFVRPKTASRAADAGETDRLHSGEHKRIAVKKANSRAAENVEISLFAVKRAAVMISHYGNDRNLR